MYPPRPTTTKPWLLLVRNVPLRPVTTKQVRADGCRPHRDRAAGRLPGAARAAGADRLRADPGVPAVLPARFEDGPDPARAAGLLGHRLLRAPRGAVLHPCRLDHERLSGDR